MIYGKTPKQLQDGRFFVKATRDDGENARVFVQLNNTTILSEFSGDDEIILQVDESQREKLTAIDENTLRAAKELSSEWFKKDLSEKTLTAAYSKSVSDDHMTVTKMTHKGNVLTKVYDHKKTLVENPDIEDGTLCDVLLEFTGVWFLKKTYGPVWRLVQVRLKAPPRKKKIVAVPDYMFEGSASEPESGDDEEDEYS